jgi:uncharacterized membrane protein HdeD (DUF308 family)
MNKSVVAGIVLIIIGLIFLLPSFTNLTLRDLWPVLMLCPGILFFLGYVADRKNYGLLMPGAILTTYGLLFLYCSLTDWYQMRDLWPLYLIGPGIGFFLLYYLGRKETVLLVLGSILTILGLIFLIRSTDYDYLWPVIIIGAGLLLILNSRQKNPEKTPDGH